MEEQLLLGENNSLIVLRKAWEKTLKLLEPEINRPSFESFFRTAKPMSMDGVTARIGAASELAKIFLEKYSELVRTALEASLNTEIDVVFSVMPKEQPKARAAEVKENKPSSGSNISSVSLPLNDKYTFSNFIVGSCNRMAHAVMKSVSEKPGSVYNPVFIYGGPGLGKTHLLQAVGHQVVEEHPEMRIAFVSGEIFTSHYVAALREHKSDEFRKKYRSIDLWLVDDIQFIAGKEKTKEEFFLTFNALYQMNKQIVLCSDRSPRELSEMEERLTSRFEAGIVCDIAAPDLETRIAILLNKAAQERANVPMEVIQFVAEVIQTNIRALEGALVTLLAYTSLMKADLTVDLAQEVLGRYLSEKRRTELKPDAVQRAVAKAFGVTAEDLCGKKRQKEMVTPRHVAMYLIRELTECTLPAIGKAFGGRNHATVLHGCSRVAELLEKDEELKELVNRLAEDLKSGR